MSDLQIIGHLDIKGFDVIKRVYSPRVFPRHLRHAEEV